MHLIQHNRYQRDKENGNCLKCRCKTILIQPSQETWASSTNTLAEAISDLTEAIKYGVWVVLPTAILPTVFLPTTHFTDRPFDRQPVYGQPFYRQLLTDKN
jgi:hypothetical protein